MHMLLQLEVQKNQMRKIQMMHFVSERVFCGSIFWRIGEIIVILSVDEAVVFNNINLHGGCVLIQLGAAIPPSRHRRQCSRL